MDVNFPVQIEPFAEKHYIKKFSRKYKSHWDVTLTAIKAELERIDALLKTDRAILISENLGVKIVKTKFRVSGTKESAKTSGNRCIVAWHQEKKTVSILLVYNKTDLSSHNETAEWQNVIKNNYPEYKKFF